MSNSLYNSKEFKKLQSKWYKKLADAGFEDIEQEDGNLKRWASSVFKSRYDPTLFAAKEEYYRLAGQFLHDHVFDTRVEKMIWERHTAGISQEDIHLQLKARGIKIGHCRVTDIVMKLARIMVLECNVKT
jgi:hypothetical protein